MAGTQVTSISEVNVVGILAQMGSRVINEVSNIMFDKFSKNFQACCKRWSQLRRCRLTEAKPHQRRFAGLGRRQKALSSATTPEVSTRSITGLNRYAHAASACNRDPGQRA